VNISKAINECGAVRIYDKYRGMTKSDFGKEKGKVKSTLEGIFGLFL
jgi:hypothetical protein